MRLADEAATRAAGALLALVLEIGDVVALSGPLGAGKTSFARGVIEGLGFQGEVASPTFPIVLPYAPPDLRLPVWHVDLYRIDDPDEANELGLDEARVDAAMIVEWPERLGTALWPDALQLALTEAAGGRVLTARVPRSWEARWPSR